MPIRKELRRYYPIDWPQISQWVRFERARGRCEHCGRPHMHRVRCLPDGSWYDEGGRVWRNGRGSEALWPDLVDRTHTRVTKVVLAAAHLDHDPANNRPDNLRSLCQRAPRPAAAPHARPHHLPHAPRAGGSVRGAIQPHMASCNARRTRAHR